jgi:fructoselysine-6-P-deglycase FrlB-like protein
MSITYHEIQDQFAAMTRTAQAVDGRFADIARVMEACGQYVFVGCGSSYAVARSGAMMARTRLQKPAMAIAAGDLLLHGDTYLSQLKDAVVVVLSRSGETSEVLRAVERVRELGVNCNVLGVSCVEGSALATHSDLMVEMPWAFDQSVCQTRTVSCLYLFCAYGVARMGGDEGLAGDLLKALAGGPAFMKTYEQSLKEAAQGDWAHAVVLGDAELSGLCEEGALAFKEICQVPSNYYHVLDVRHGPMVLVNQRSLVVAVLSGAEKKLELDVLRDIVAKGATVIAYSDQPFHMPGVLVCSFGRELSHPARGIPAIAMCQLLAYYKSFLTGADPDRPDGLSPWIALN